MSFFIFRQRRAPAHVPGSSANLLWGVRRRRGYSEIDDPSAHRGLTQHAFVVGAYDVAMCGVKTYGRRRPKFVRLAVPTAENPTCRECSVAIAVEVSDVVPLYRIRELTAPADREDVLRFLASAPRLLTQGEPISFEAQSNERASTKTHAWPVKDFSQAA